MVEIIMGIIINILASLYCFKLHTNIEINIQYIYIKDKSNIYLCDCVCVYSGNVNVL